MGQQNSAVWNTEKLNVAHDFRQVRRSPLIGFGIATLALLELIGASPSWANPRFNPTASNAIEIAQVLNQLPPPPSVPFGDQPLPAVIVEPTPGIPAIAPPASGSSREQYLVYINGDSPLMLSQVQAVEPSALPREYQGRTVIQAGVFSTETNARRQVELLESRGIGANIERVTASTPIEPARTAALPRTQTLSPAPGTQEIEFGQQPNFEQAAINGRSSIPVLVPPAADLESPQRSSTPARYFVVIPGDRDEIWAMSRQVDRLLIDAPEEAIQYSDSPLGPHVQVGPFRDRGTARNWENYFRAFGMDARVHYRR